jgi:hypothetical protein
MVEHQFPNENGNFMGIRPVFVGWFNPQFSKILPVESS